MKRPIYTAKMISDMARQTNDTKLVTLSSMATGSVGTINYGGNLYEVRVTPVSFGIEKWSHPKTSKRKGVSQ